MFCGCTCCEIASAALLHTCSLLCVRAVAAIAFIALGRGARGTSTVLLLRSLFLVALHGAPRWIAYGASSGC
jgi:hypothetical protein